MKFSMLKVKDVVVVELRGDVWGGWDSLELKDSIVRMLGAGERKFVIDLEGIGSVNSAGIGVLLAVQESIRGARGTMYLCEVNERSRRAFSISAVWEEFQAHPTRLETLEALGVPPPGI